MLIMNGSYSSIWIDDGLGGSVSCRTCSGIWILTFNADEIRLYVGDIPNLLRNSNIVETITEVNIVKTVCYIISQGEFIDFEGMFLTHLRSVSILSSEYKGLAFIYTLQQDDRNNIYICSMMENGGYKINEIFGYISK